MSTGDNLDLRLAFEGRRKGSLVGLSPQVVGSEFLVVLGKTPQIGYNLSKFVNLLGLFICKVGM